MDDSIPESNQRDSVWKKIGKGLAALVLFFGLISPTKITFSIPTVIIIVIAVVVLMLYWHALENFYDGLHKVVAFFEDLRKDGFARKFDI
ncbi:MAG: hypothetical protein ACE5FT_05310 [Candidatus Nanoarchaeia archaeon]